MNDMEYAETLADMLRSLDDSTLQKARTKFLQAYEGNMMVRGEGDDIWYQRLWRQLTPETMEAIVEQSQRFLLPLFRFNQS